MNSQSKTVHKKSRGRPAGTNYGETIPARLDKKTVDLLDEYAKNSDISRSEAVRRLLAFALMGRAIEEDDSANEDHPMTEKKSTNKPRLKMLQPRIKTLDTRIAKPLKKPRKPKK